MASIAVTAGVWGIKRLLARLAPQRLREAEDLLPPGTGATKKQMVLESLRPVLAQLATAGIAEALPDDSVIGQILEEILTAEKAKPDWKEKGVLSVGGKRLVVQVIGEL
jgi:hypothetical protein